MNAVESFERWVSLGNYCLTKYQINRYIARNHLELPTNSTLEAIDLIKNTPREKLHVINGGNLFFDWVVVEDYNKIIGLLESGFDYKLSEENLSEIFSPAGVIESIRCSRSGVRWVHLFSNEKNLLDWRDQIPDLNGKISHLRSEFLGLRNFKSLYIVTMNADMVSRGVPLALENALLKLRQGSGREFKLLVCIPEDIEIPSHGRILYRTYSKTPNYEQYPWLGNAASWDEAFRGLSLRQA